MKLVEIAKFTDDVAAMASFYRGLLGTEPVAESTEMTIFLTGETRIFIHRLYEPGSGDLKPENHTGFEVENVDTACDTLRANGMTLEIPPCDYDWGRSAYLRDPDGSLVEIIQSENKASV